jgi:peptide/nickel transport system permease protein
MKMAVQSSTYTLSQEQLNQISELRRKSARERIGRSWYKFSRNPLSVIGALLIIVITLAAIFAPWITPYPESAKPFTDFSNALKAPSLAHLFGTDEIGRDVFSRVVFGSRFSLLIGVVVLFTVVPIGVLLGIVAGYYRGTWIETVIMRITDVFLGVPPLILALAIAAVLKPNLINSMIAISAMWWPWYTRLAYGMACTLRNEYFVINAEITGAKGPHILFREILPNMLAPIFTKMSLDMGWAIIFGAMLSFVGLGVQPPTPDLGSMVSDGAEYLPEFWWVTLFPAFGIVVIVLGFNLLGDGLNDLFAAEKV